jgi:hypothetical protein
LGGEGKEGMKYWAKLWVLLNDPKDREMPSVQELQSDMDLVSDVGVIETKILKVQVEEPDGEE